MTKEEIDAGIERRRLDRERWKLLAAQPNLEEFLKKEGLSSNPLGAMVQQQAAQVGPPPASIPSNA